MAVFWIHRNASASVILQLRHEDALGPVDRLAGLEALAQVGDLGLERLQLGPPGPGDVDRRHEVGGGERLDDVGHHAGVAGPLDELGLAERREHDDRGDPLPRRSARRR